LREGGVEVHELDQGIRFRSGISLPRNGQDQGNAGREFVVVCIGPEALFSEVEAVVSPQQDHGSIRQVKFGELLEQPTGKGVDVADAGIISVPELLRLGCAQLAVPRDIRVAFQFPPTADTQLRGSFGILARDGRGYFFALIEISIFLRGAEGEVRLAETHCEEERFALFLQVGQCLFGTFADETVDVDVVPDVGGFRGGPLVAFSFQILLCGVAQLWVMHVVVQGCFGPRRRIFGWLAATVEYLADGAGMVAVVLEVLGQCDRFGQSLPKMRIEIPDLYGVRPQSRK
jgi:hypothetical protein